MNLPADYYHCFLGNGLDAVLIGYTGSMVSDKVGVDRCAWYKSDRYYPEDKLVMVAGRWPIDKPLEHGKGSGWYEITPLGRTWYQVFLPEQEDGPLPVSASRQRFVPKEGTLYSDVSFGSLHVQVTTFLHAQRSLLIERYHFDRDVELQAWMVPGVKRMKPITQGAVCTALHNLLLQADDDEIRVFPAVPSGWSEAAFERLLANGCEVSASVRRNSDVIEGYLVNVTAEPLDLRLRIGQQDERLKIASGETYHFKSTP